MGRKALRAIFPEMPESEQQRLEARYDEAVVYSRTVGNLYTGSLYLGLISLLDNGNLGAGDRIGLFSYGSGAVSEFFSMTLMDGFKSHLTSEKNQALLSERKQLSIDEYEKCLTKNSQPMEVRIRSLIQLILLSIKSAVIFVITISSIIGKGQLTDQLAF